LKIFLSSIIAAPGRPSKKVGHCSASGPFSFLD
jgi:hypothetical protein